MKDAFAEVVESWSERLEHLRAYSTAGVRPDCDFFLWKITERYDGPRRARRRAERHAARRLARDAVLVPRDDEGVAVHARRAGRGRSSPRARRTSSSTRS